MPGQATVTINGKQWSVSVATTSAELTQGLGGVSSIPAGTGMLFDLGGDQVVSVTTVPMLFNLDIVFISSGLQVMDVARNVAPGYVLTENTPIRYFLEVNAGESLGIAVGDSVNIEGYMAPTVAAFDFGSIIGAFLPLLVMFFFFIMARMVMSRMFPPTPVITPRKELPRLTEEEKLQQRKTTLQNKGKEMAREASVEFLRLEEGWQAEHEVPKYRFKDPATGQEFVALDLEDLKWKLSVIRGHHSSPLTKEELVQRHPKWLQENISAILAEPTELDQIRDEVLCETPCVKCGKEMGEHRFSAGVFICPSVRSPAKEYWYLGEWWEEEYSTAECVVYRSKDGKKRLYVYWDGTHEVKPAPTQKFIKGQIITIKSEVRHIYLGRTTATVQADDPKYSQVWTEEIPAAVAYKDIEEAHTMTCSSCGSIIFRTGEKYYDTPAGIYCFHCVPQIYKKADYERIYYPSSEHYSGASPQALKHDKRVCRACGEETIFIIPLPKETPRPCPKCGADTRFITYLDAFTGKPIPPEGQGHHSMWLTPEQRKPLEEKYGAVAVRWAEEATRPGDIKAAERAAEYYYKKITEALGLGHLSPELTEQQIMKLREVLGLDRDVAKVLKIHRETGYVP